jgi:hypothetical protein
MARHHHMLGPTAAAHRELPGMGWDAANCHLDTVVQLVRHGRELPAPPLEHQNELGEGAGGCGGPTTCRHSRRRI